MTRVGTFSLHMYRRHMSPASRPALLLVLAFGPYACGSDAPSEMDASGDSQDSNFSSDTNEAASDTSGSTSVGDGDGDDVTGDGDGDASTGGTPLVLSLERNVPGFGQLSIDGEACGGTECTLVADAGTSVTISASPANGYIEFGGWTLLGGSADCSGEASCSFELTETTQLRAEFNPLHNLAFRTAGSYLASEMDGLAGADQICADEASANELPGENWVAWLSTSTVDARDRVTGSRGWIRLDARPVVDQLDGGTPAALFNPVVLAPAPEPLWADVYTGTAPAGTMGSDTASVQPDNCDDWTSDTGSATVGLATAIGTPWTDSYVTECTFARPFYCFSTGLDTALLPEPSTGRTAFLSSTTFTPSGGLAGADALCTNDAVNAGLSGSFKAALSTSAASASSRFDLSGDPWVLVDGTPIVASATDLELEDGLLRGINITADGTVRTGPSSIDSVTVPDPLWAYTGGTFGTTSTLENNCEDWSSAEPGTNAGMGNLQSGHTPGQSCCSGPCTNDRYVYCLQE